VRIDGGVELLVLRAGFERRYALAHERAVTHLTCRSSDGHNILVRVGVGSESGGGPRSPAPGPPRHCQSLRGRGSSPPSIHSISHLPRMKYFPARRETRRRPSRTSRRIVDFRRRNIRIASSTP